MQPTISLEVWICFQTRNKSDTNFYQWNFFSKGFKNFVFECYFSCFPDTNLTGWNKYVVQLKDFNAVTFLSHKSRNINSS